MRQIAVTELAAWLQDEAREPPRLLDVREAWEFDLCQLPGAQLMPMASVPARCHELAPAQPLVVICHHGVRSAHVCHFLEAQGFEALFNLSGGMAAWAAEIDPTMAQY